MKQEFRNFQVSKETMNQLRGGVDAGHVEICHCAGGANFSIIVNETVNMFDVMDEACNGGDWACSPQK